MTPISRVNIEDNVLVTDLPCPPSSDTSKTFIKLVDTVFVIYILVLNFLRFCIMCTKWVFYAWKIQCLSQKWKDLVSFYWTISSVQSLVIRKPAAGNIVAVWKGWPIVGYLCKKHVVKLNVLKIFTGTPILIYCNARFTFSYTILDQSKTFLSFTTALEDRPVPCK